MPHLEAAGNTQKLVVDGKPFVMLAGEVHNSASSSPAYMEQIWDLADALELNSLILQARAHGKKIQFLWFGAWKNAQCFYAPAWVKRNTERFLRAEVKKGDKAVRNAYGME